uniref:Uncharacterized protein n=1 Tax=Phaeodactylum tricornutum TaxID=2850 RepID=A0A8J9X1F2_PHATR
MNLFRPDPTTTLALHRLLLVVFVESLTMVPTETDPLVQNGNGNARNLPRAFSYRSMLAATVLIVSGAGGVVWWMRRHSIRTPSGNGASSSHSLRNNFTMYLDEYQTHEYTATQFISFTINTLGGLQAHGECEGRHVDPDTNSCYLGNTKNISEDILHRVAIVERVLQRLEQDAFDEDPEIDSSPSVLKIFAMPEFFLRGPNGAYSSYQMIDREGQENDGLLVRMADRIRKFIAKPAFQDYLFVFGTVLVAESLDDPGKGFWEIENVTADSVLYSNFAPIYKGGTGHKHQYLLQKRYISGADFLSRTTLPNPVKANLRDYADASELSFLQQTLQNRNTVLVEGNVIELDGLRIGVEICLDHRMGSLWRSIQAQNPRGAIDNDNLVDVQLIVSAGMSIERGPNPVRTGGVVYLSDGEASSAVCLRTDTGVFDPDVVCREHGPGGRQHLQPFGGAGYTNFVSVSGCIDMEEIELLQGYYSMYQPQGCANTLKTYGIDVMDEFKYYPPSLEIYPIIGLPPQREK